MTPAPTAPTDLRVEHVTAPLGITVRKPRLSWRLPPGTRSQLAYRIRAGEWDSGRVESDRSLLVPYGGPPLRSGERVRWTVKVWTDAGESPWSEEGWWELGLLDPDDWTARWIEPAEPDAVRAQTLHPAYLLRRAFVIGVPIARARLYATAHGIYELFLNGHRVGDAELTPGSTSYQSHLHVQTYDVTGLLKEGENVVGAILSDGWFRGQNGGLRLSSLYGDRVALLAQLHVADRAGSLTRIGTGEEWRTATGSIVAADLMEGQTVDLRRARRGWSLPGASQDGWSTVAIREYDLGRLTASPAPPVRRVEHLLPIAVTRPRPDRQVVDLGQNINGWVELTALGPTGTRLTLTYGEVLDADGDITQQNLIEQLDGHGLPWDLSNMRRPLQVDHVTSAGDPGDVFEPRHTTHGFRYVRVEGHRQDLARDDVRGVVVHTDLRRTGWFECSDERINRLHEAAVWSFRGNACDVPVDCPTRERTAWTGDWQVFVEAATFLYDVAGFSTKWLRDLAAEQRSDGAVLHSAPTSTPMDVEGNPTPPGSAGWGDAAVIVPWQIHRAYDDVRLLEEQWDSMVAWVEYAARAARDGRHPTRVAARPRPAPHEAYLWDTGYHWGEWLEPGAFESYGHGDPVAAAAAADHGAVATAYLHHSSGLLARIARLLERVADEARFRALADATRCAWQQEFVRPDGTLTPHTQANHVRALAFGLIAGDRRGQVAEQLVQLIRAAGTHLGTGFLTTPYLLPVLADEGHLDVAYELLQQDTEPSWLTMIERGATTMWEAWNGIDADGVPHLSHNHYSKGAVVSFLHRYVAGIRLLDDAPAYKRFQVAPQPGGGIGWARGVHESPYGRIEAAWSLNGDRFELDLTVPPGSTAEVLLPNGTRRDAHAGAARFTCVLGP